MAAKRPTLYNLKDIEKVPAKTEVRTCGTCGKLSERKPGRVFICFWCGGSDAKEDKAGK